MDERVSQQEGERAAEGEADREVYVAPLLKCFGTLPELTKLNATGPNPDGGFNQHHS